MRIYDPRVGRFLSVDPLQTKYPWYTPYQFTGNSPITNLDRAGEEEYHYTMTLDQQGKTNLKLTSTEYENHHSWFGGLFKFDTKIATERYVVSYSGNTYYIGFASNPGRNNNWKMAEFKQFLKDPDAQAFVMTFDDSRTENRNAFFSDMQIAAVSSLAMYEHISTTIKNSKIDLASEWMGSEEKTKYVDNNKPVYIEKLSEGTKLIQYRVKGQEGTMGNYYALPGTRPEQIGLDPNEVVGKLNVTVKKSTEVLISTHIKNAPYYANPSVKVEGGGVQIYSSDLKNNVEVNK